MEKGRGMTYPVFTILTKDSSPEIGFIHDRMPVILPQSSVGDWINPNKKADGIVEKALSDVFLEKVV